ncbi:MAG: hypothetical protein DIU56_000155 [Pseudomonadota bacterium]|jgi:hypothetical protein
MSARADAERIAQRRRLLEIEAEMQRIALAATFAAWEERRVTAWAATLGTLALQLLAIPRIRWLLLASVLAKLKPRSRRS